MLKQLSNHRGLFIIMTVCLVTLWLYFADKLVLFIHPRYFLFTAIFAAAGLAFSIIALCINRTHDDHEEDPLDHKHQNDSKIKNFAYLGITAVIILVFALFTPSSLSTQNVNLARVNNFTFGVNDNVDVSNIEQLTVKNWSTILSGNLAFNNEEAVSLTGFVVPIDKDNFFLTRYVLSCCAIDAQPVAVPIYAPNWEASNTEGDWVSVEGSFEEATVDGYSNSLVPSALKTIDEPDEPYDY